MATTTGPAEAGVAEAGAALADGAAVDAVGAAAVALGPGLFAHAQHKAAAAVPTVIATAAPFGPRPIAAARDPGRT
jgi:hypothetical protein